jgi:hydrogenase small subunit
LAGSTTAASLLAPRARHLSRTVVAAAAAVGLPAWASEKMAERIARGDRPRVVWLRLRTCAGCSEPVRRLAEDAAAMVELLELELEAPPAPEEREALERGGYVLVLEGAVRLRGGGLECPAASLRAADRVKRLADRAAAVLAAGSCTGDEAAAPGAPARPPRPRGPVLDGRGVVTLPGCPADPNPLLGTVLQLATFGTLPALDAEGRPHHAFGHVVHEDCPRRPHFDAGRLARTWGDAGHAAGHCLYALGCTGPATPARCALLPSCETPGRWPLSIAHPCVGCAEQGISSGPPPRGPPPLDEPSPPAVHGRGALQDARVRA